jgi:hypothetical protein
MKISRQLLLWSLAVGAAVAAGSTAVAAAGPRSEILTPAQISANLAQARASAMPRRTSPTLRADEWAGLLPSAGITARCAGTRMELTDWSEATRTTKDLEIHPGPADTISLNYLIGGGTDIRIVATGRCVKGLPTGSYTLGDEPTQRIPFGKWVDTGIIGCAWSNTPATPDPNDCGQLPIMALSALPPPK